MRVLAQTESNEVASNGVTRGGQFLPPPKEERRSPSKSGKNWPLGIAQFDVIRSAALQKSAQGRCHGYVAPGNAEVFACRGVRAGRCRRSCACTSGFATVGGPPQSPREALWRFQHTLYAPCGFDVILLIVLLYHIHFGWSRPHVIVKTTRPSRNEETIR